MDKRKSISLALAKGLGAGAIIAPEQLAKIQKYLLVDVDPAQLYVRKMYLAHNAIDRDGERFSEAVLADFVITLPGKSLLIGHKWGDPGEGIFFDVALEDMSLSTAVERTGEALKLPEGVASVKLLVAWFYTVKLPSTEDLLAKIDAGIARYVSISFSAADRVKATNEKTGEYYYEYKTPAEALEGSLVWLGAQPGASIAKSAKDGVDIEGDGRRKTKETIKMKKTLNALGLGDDATDDQASKAAHQMAARLKTLEEVVAPLGDNATKASAEELVKSSEDGKVFRKDLVDRQIKYERLLGRTGETPEAIGVREKQLMRREITEIKGDVAHLEKLAREKFPDKAGIDGGQPGAERDNKGEEDKYNYRKMSKEG